MKNAGFGKRFLAYIIDMIVISVVGIFITVFIPMQEVDTSEANTALENYMNGEITVEKYMNETASVNYELEQSRIPEYIVSLTLTFVYFVILQYKLNGQTVGKKVLNIRVENNKKGKLSVNSLIFRSLIINEIGFSMLSLLSILVFNEGTYTTVSGILNMLNLCLILICAVMVIANKDKRGLHDVIAGTKVVELEK